jgi:hypothetical protein
MTVLYREVGVAYPHPGDLDEHLARPGVGQVERLDGELGAEFRQYGGGNFHDVPLFGVGRLS